MRNTFGNALQVTLFGESHGEAIGCVIDGLPAGIEINSEYINERLSLRRPQGAIATARVEPDEYKFLSGVVAGKTTGTPIAVIIENQNTRSGDYDNLKCTPRPSHADYTAHIKYKGFEDARGGGHFSGRITAALVIAGAIAETVLNNLGITVTAHIKSIGGVLDRPFKDYLEDAKILKNKPFGVLDDKKGEEMIAEILAAKQDGDSIGGVIETAVLGLKAGVGEPWFDTLEGVISKAVFSVPGVKGIEFGVGFKLAEMRGSEANDPFEMVEGKVLTTTNNMGGILGGISSGMPIIFSAAIKPTPSIAKEQKTVDLKANTNTTITVGGRHDPCIVARARPVIESVTALSILDMLMVNNSSNF